jgi:palmitoyl-protein thioesterase
MANSRSIALVICFIAYAIAAPLPVIMWHGMGDSCCFPFSMGRIQTLIQSQFNSSIPIHSIGLGSNFVEDVTNSYLMVMLIL